MGNLRCAVVIVGHFRSGAGAVARRRDERSVGARIVDPLARRGRARV
jgi:hypothetical protein